MQPRVTVALPGAHQCQGYIYHYQTYCLTMFLPTCTRPVLVLATNQVDIWCPICIFDTLRHLQVALGLPLLPKVPITKAEAKRRASVKLLPLGMALLAAESFVQERLYSADICKNVLGS